MEKQNSVYRFKIELKDFEPTVWRRIQVPEGYTFWELHVGIADSIGWADYHLHQFMVTDPSSNEEVSIRTPLTPSRTSSGIRKRPISNTTVNFVR